MLKVYFSSFNNETIKNVLQREMSLNVTSVKVLKNKWKKYKHHVILLLCYKTK